MLRIIAALTALSATSAIADNYACDGWGGDVPFTLSFVDGILTMSDGSTATVARHIESPNPGMNVVYEDFAHLYVFPYVSGSKPTTESLELKRLSVIFGFHGTKCVLID
jgi:hypothetical protein